MYNEEDRKEAMRRFGCPEMNDAHEFHLALADSFKTALRSR